jgi:hypothetical protein
MCFSAAGSFGVSVVLTGVGIASVARNSSGLHRMFAAIPLIFAAQQAAEGEVWLTIAGPPEALLHRVAVTAFLGLALVIWPIWVPCALRLMERNAARRRALTVICWFGCCVSVCAALLLTRWQPVAYVAGHSIRYDYPGSSDTPRDILLPLAYLTATIVPLFVSTAKLARTLGVTLIVSLVATIIVQRDALTSVWCFFAAILSGVVFVAVGRELTAIAPPRIVDQSPAWP